MITRFRHKKLPRFVAHRGAVTHRSENTKEAFDVAYSYKHQFENIGSSVSFEFDVRLTKDNMPVLIHDPNTIRTTGVDCVVANTTYADMQQIDFSLQHPNHSATLIALEQMFQTYPDVVFNLEIKETNARGIQLADIINTLIRKYDSAHRMIVHIPCFRVSQYAQKTFPNPCLFELPSKLIDRFTHAVYQDEPAPYYTGYHQMCMCFMKKDSQNPDILHTYTDKKYADASRKAGYKILTYWQYDAQGDHTEQTVRNAIEVGADSLILDDIEMALRVFKEYT